MKFLFIFQIILSCISYIFGKSHLKHPDPSYNPIRSNWISGPRIDLPIQYSKKLTKNNKALLAHHSYKETTRNLQKKALHGHHH